MHTTQDAFHTMRGHVADGTTVSMDNGDVLKISAGMYGWNITDQTGRIVAHGQDSARAVECFIVNYDGSAHDDR